jgi:hypothetical protein
VDDVLRRVLAADRRVGFALLFGSHATGTDTPFSDLDIAIGSATGAALDHRAIGELTSRLESAAGRPVDLVVLDEAPPGVAYRIFRDGRVLLERDRPALVRQQVSTILQYLDFKPVEQLCARSILQGVGDGR